MKSNLLLPHGGFNLSALWLPFQHGLHNAGHADTLILELDATCLFSH